MYRSFIIFILLTCIFTVPLQANADTIKLFGTKERKSSRLKSFQKWVDMLDRHFDGNNTTSRSCDQLSTGQCNVAKWNRFVDDMKQQDTTSQIRKVNSHMNNYRYIIDPINWGLPDYWATPFQFFIKDGDCEDYAISKYMTLKALGFPEDNMRIVVLKDHNLDIMHAVLAVYANNTIYILDNQISSVVEHSSIHHYEPVYSINESAWWRHR